MKTTNPAGFTLLEALIVVTIISILAVLLFPLGKQFTNRSRNVQCIQNLKTLGSGLLLYTNDHNGKLPPTTELPHPGPAFGNNVPSWGPTWAEYIVKMYLHGEKKVLRCPSRPSNWSATSFVGNYPEYGLNERLTPMNAGTGYREGMRLASLTSPSQLVLLADVARFSGDKAMGGFYRIYSASDLHPRHLESHVNVLYADMHIESHRLDRKNLPKETEPLGLKAFRPQ